MQQYFIILKSSIFIFQVASSGLELPLCMLDCAACLVRAHLIAWSEKQVSVSAIMVVPPDVSLAVQNEDAATDQLDGT